MFTEFKYLLSVRNTKHYYKTVYSLRSESKRRRRSPGGIGVHLLAARGIMRDVNYDRGRQRLSFSGVRLNIFVVRINHTRYTQKHAFIAVL